MASLTVFRDDRERSMMCGRETAPIFGSETEKVLKLCTELLEASLSRGDKSKIEPLKKRIFGIAKTYHLYVKWYGEGKPPLQPDRFLVSGRGHERYAVIQV